MTRKQHILCTTAPKESQVQALVCTCDHACFILAQVGPLIDWISDTLVPRIHCSEQTITYAQVDGIKILEGLAASGLRSIRYALEVEGTGRVDANDLDSDAVEAMKRNIQFNGAEAEQRMRPLQGDARVVMLQSPLVSPISIIAKPVQSSKDSI